MAKKIGILIRRIIFAFLFIYACNRVSMSYNLYIPFNYITIGLVTLFGIPSIFCLVLFAIFYI